MAIQGLQEINVGLPNESTGSDSLYTAFTKTKNNFANLFANASPTPVAGNGITVSNVSNVITVSANLVAGNNTVLTNSNGAIVIESLGGNATSTITGVIAGAGLSGGGYFGNVTLNLSTTGVTAAQYTNPTITIDAQGRITSASNNSVAGTVTSIGLTPGPGIGINGGPITSNGNITVTNTGVTRITAGTGISVTSGNGNVTINATPPAAVTSVGISSSQLVISGSPILSAGVISVNLPTNVTFAGNVTTGNVFANSGNVVSNRAIANSVQVNSNVTTNGLVANTGQINGNLVVTGNISPAAANKIGGIKPGPGVDISLDGELTIDTANLPLSFGNFTANNNVLSIVNVDEDMILQTEGNAEIQLIGAVGFYKPDGLPPNVANRFFSVTADGEVTIFVSNVSPNTSAVNIIGSTSTDIQEPINTGVMLQITGQTSDPARLYLDAIGGYAGYIGRRYNGTATSPTQVLDGEEISRLGINGYTSNGWISIGQARISFVSTDDQSDTDQGTKIEFWSTPKGNTVANRTKTLELDASFGANIIGNIGVTGTANITGNANVGNLGTTTGIFTANVTAGNLFSTGAITSNSATAGVGYSAGAGGTATQNNSKSDPVTLNKITGEITMDSAQLGGDSTVSFTLNNSTIANTDVMIINQVSTANAGEYSFNSICNSGNAVISVHNLTNTNRSDAIVLRYVVIKGATS